jgi:hypothetical protein
MKPGDPVKILIKTCLETRERETHHGNGQLGSI